MANNSKKANFPMSLYGEVANNAIEAREICLKHFRNTNAAHAAKEKRHLEMQISGMMSQGFTRHEAKHIAMGGALCNSVSVFV